VTRTSASIDQNTRTLLVEVQVRNRRGRLMPGMYVQVNLIESKNAPPILIPGEAIVIRNGQTVVAVVEDQTVHMRPIVIGRDYGDESEITKGLKAGEVLALNVSDEVHDGGKIQPEFSENKAGPGGPQKKQDNGNEGKYGNQGLTNQQQGAAQPKK